MRIRTVAIVAVSAGLGLSAVAWAANKATTVAGGEVPACLQDQPGRPLANFIRKGVRSLMTLRGDLNLTADQKEQIRTAVRGHKEQIVPVAKDLLAKREALREAVLAEDPSETDIRAAADALGKSIGDAAVLASKVAGEVKPLLTDQQKQTIKQFRLDRQDSAEKFLDEAMLK